MPADTVEVIVKLSGLATVQAGMRRLRDAVTAPLEAAVSRVRNFALGMGGTLLAGLSVYRVGTEIKRAVSEMDRADEVAQKLGIAADQLTALDYAATLADSSAESLQNALKFLAPVPSAWTRLRGWPGTGAGSGPAPTLAGTPARPGSRWPGSMTQTEPAQGLAHGPELSQQFLPKVGLHRRFQEDQGLRGGQGVQPFRGQAGGFGQQRMGQLAA